MNYCPVCGYALAYPPTDFHICPSCGTEFGYDDSGTTYEELRSRWISSGPSWWSPADPMPRNWDPFEQMKRGVVLNGAGTFTGAQGFPVQAAGFLGETSTHQVWIRRKRPTSQGRLIPGSDLTPKGAIAFGGR
jgi:hypothetical protein